MPNRSQSGIALIGVLWVLALLSIAAAGAAASLRHEMRTAGYLKEAARAYAAAQAGVHLGLLALTGSGAGERWPADGTVHEIPLEGATVRFTISDESGKLDLNHAPALALAGVLGSEAIAAAVAAARPFTSVDELMRVPGVAPALHRRVKPALTVHARQPGVLPHAASREVLLAMPGIDAAEVDRYLAAKDRGRAEPPRADAGAFARNGSATFCVHAQALLPGGATAHAAAVVDVRRPQREAPFLVLDWRRDGPELFPAREVR